MKIEWKKVTWYSKAAALVLFVGLPFLGFWLGTRYGEIEGYVAAGKNAGQMALQNETENAAAAYYTDTGTWQTGMRPDAGFSIAYPLDFPTNDIYRAASAPGWRANTATDGSLYFTLTIPKVFEPQTNLIEATLTAGSSGSALALAGCLTPDPGAVAQGAATSSAVINGTTFVVFHSGDVGAGNYYDTTSYRTVHDGRCWAVEYTIHSGQIMNYPASYGLKPFDRAKLTSVLDRIVGTFTFIK